MWILFVKCEPLEKTFTNFLKMDERYALSNIRFLLSTDHQAYTVREIKECTLHCMETVEKVLLQGVKDNVFSATSNSQVFLENPGEELIMNIKQAVASLLFIFACVCVSMNTNADEGTIVAEGAAAPTTQTQEPPQTTTTATVVQAPLRQCKKHQPLQTITSLRWE